MILRGLLFVVGFWVLMFTIGLAVYVYGAITLAVLAFLFFSVLVFCAAVDGEA